MYHSHNLTKAFIHQQLKPHHIQWGRCHGRNHTALHQREKNSRNYGSVLTAIKYEGIIIKEKLQQFT